MTAFTNISLFLDFFTSFFTPPPTAPPLDNSCSLSIATLFNPTSSKQHNLFFWNNGKFLIKGTNFTAHSTQCTTWHYKQNSQHRSMHRCKFHNGRTAVEESRSRSFSIHCHQRMGEKNVTYWFLWTWAVQAMVHLLIWYVSPVSIHLYPLKWFNIDSITPHMKLATALSATSMAHAGLESPWTHVYPALLPHSHWACAARRATGRPVCEPHIAPAHTPTLAPSIPLLPSWLATSFISYPSPPAYISYNYTLILLLNSDKGGGELTRHK